MRLVKEAGKRLTFSASDLETTKKNSVKPDLNNSKLSFGHVSTDHMVSISYDHNRGWDIPRISPLQPLQLHPFNATLHYALTCFEGLKAYNGKDGRLRLFRPMMNMNRFLNSCKRLAFPSFDPKELLNVIEEFVKIESHWIPKTEGSTLYLRPLAISNTNVLGVHKSPDMQILVMACPVSSYFSASKIKLAVYEDYWRGTPHSAAAYKIGSNYGPTVQITAELEQKGYSQAVWVYNDCFLESGASNLFFIVETEKGKPEMITAPLDGSILPGITRSSILELASDVVPGMKVTERHFKISEFINLHKKGQIKEIFVSGTAAVIGEVHSIAIRGEEYDINYAEASSLICNRIKKHILDTQFGSISHPFSYIIE